MAITCRVCGSRELRRLWADADGHDWRRCRSCGSDTSSAEYDPGRYGAGYVAGLIEEEGGSLAHARANHEHNAALFDRFHPGPAGRTFLDVGCGHGASLDVMAARGWFCAGWDVGRDGRPKGRVTVSPEFRAAGFGRAFDAVLAREVLEHAPDPHALLRELAAAVAPGGVLQVTTPRPVGRPERRCYHWAHLSVWSATALARAAGGLGLEVLHHAPWRLGQRLACRRPGSTPPPAPG